MQQPLRVLDFDYACAAEGPDWVVNRPWHTDPRIFPAMSAVEKCDAMEE